MQKLKTFRPWAPGQTSLLPASPSDWLSADHQVVFLLDLVDELDLSAIVIPAQSKDPRGERPALRRPWLTRAPIRPSTAAAGWRAPIPASPLPSVRPASIVLSPGLVSDLSNLQALCFRCKAGQRWEARGGLWVLRTGGQRPIAAGERTGAVHR